MKHRPLRSAIVLSLGAVMALAGAVSADTARADGNVDTIVVEPEVSVGPVAPGEVRSVNVGIVLTCTGTAHLDPGQTVIAGIDSTSAPLDGAILSVTDGSVGPAPADWPAEGTVCPTPAPMFSAGTPSVVTLRAPTTPGTGYRYSLMYHRSIEPFGVNDPVAIRQLTAIDIVLDVVSNTPPTLTLPTVAGGGPLEADTSGGWTAGWAGLGATDVEDDPDPLAGCTPAAGTVLPVGTTTVTCAVTDSGGLTASATFDVTVGDTTRPTLTGMPADQHVITSDPSGTTLTYTAPGAADIADSAPTVGCAPASDTQIGPGTTTVTCTATDSSGNTATDAFDVTVTYVPPRVASAIWGAPVDGVGSTFSANRGRTIPVKLDLFVNGVERTTGNARLAVTPCGGGSAVSFDLTPGSGRWNGSLDTSGLAGSCYTVVAWIDGLEAGAFRLELRGPEPVKATKTPTRAAPKPVKASQDSTKAAKAIAKAIKPTKANAKQ